MNKSNDSIVLWLFPYWLGIFSLCCFVGFAVNDVEISFLRILAFALIALMTALPAQAFLSLILLALSLVNDGAKSKDTGSIIFGIILILALLSFFMSSSGKI